MTTSHHADHSDENADEVRERASVLWTTFAFTVIVLIVVFIFVAVLNPFK